MTIRNIIYVPDPHLRHKASPIKTFAGVGLEQLVADMVATMRQHQGVGLAGPQIGVGQRIFVAARPGPGPNAAATPPAAEMIYALLNPEISHISGTLQEGQEACLSLPGWVGLVARPTWVAVRAQDVRGQPLRLKVAGVLARIFMHEIDHLNGILYTDHISDTAKLWQEQEEEEGPGVGS
jgi:peptide deformylase